MNLGQYIQTYCLRKGISGRQFAKDANLTNGYISMLIKGINPKTNQPIMPSLQTYMKVANAMGISLDELLNNIDDAPISIIDFSSGTMDVKYQRDYPPPSQKKKEVPRPTGSFTKLFERLTAEQQLNIVGQMLDMIDDAEANDSNN